MNPAGGCHLRSQFEACSLSRLSSAPERLEIHQDCQASQSLSTLKRILISHRGESALEMGPQSSENASTTHTARQRVPRSLAEIGMQEAISPAIGKSRSCPSYGVTKARFGAELLNDG